MRPTSIEVLMAQAYLWAQRSTCPRLHVGCVIATPDNHILTSGYNGAPRGLPHCEDSGCYIVNDSCVTAIHAEQNAILQAARQGASLRGARLYVTHRPCIRCANSIIQVGIEQVFYSEGYESDMSQDRVAGMFSIAKVDLILMYGMNYGEIVCLTKS